MIIITLRTQYINDETYRNNKIIVVYTNIFRKNINDQLIIFFKFDGGAL